MQSSREAVEAVIPAEAGIQRLVSWTPAFAGATNS
jgi:hypothetical protein